MSHSNNIEHTDMKIANNSGKFYFLKKVVQIFLSVSLFSFLYSQSPHIPVLVQSFDYNYFSDFSTKLFTYKSERNYIFLLCNGILVLIIQISGVISKITPVNSNVKGPVDQEQSIKEPEFTEKKVDIVQKVELVEEKVGEGEVLITKESENGYGDEELKSLEVDDDQEYLEEEELIEELSDEELHKKCEDFIKKVKQEIQGEFQHFVTSSYVIN